MIHGGYVGTTLSLLESDVSHEIVFTPDRFVNTQITFCNSDQEYCAEDKHIRLITQIEYLITIHCSQLSIEYN